MKDFILSLVQRVRERFIKKEEVKLSLYEEIIDGLEKAICVNNHSFNSTLRFEAIEEDVAAYHNLITAAKSALTEEIIFPRKDLVLRVVKVCNFYRGEGGKFLNIAYFRRAFLEEAISYVKLYMEKDALENKSAQLQHALFRGQTIILNLYSISKSFQKSE